jgi:hypothetical protein
MLGAALLTGVVQAQLRASALIVGVMTLAATAFVGGALHRRIRSNATAQLASAAALALSGAPAAVAGGVSVPHAAVTTLAWFVVFVSSALIVRGSFVRASSKSSLDSTWVDTSAIGLAAIANFAFSLAGARGPALAAGLTAIGCAAVAAYRPSVKQLKPVGLALAGLALVAAVVLAG